MREKRNIYKWLSFASLLISIVSLCLSVARCGPLTTDWMAILVGVLSLLVAALIGWQIFSIINIDKIKKDVKEVYWDMYVNAEESKMNIYASLCDFYIAQMEKERNSITSYRYVMNQLYLIITLHNLKEYERCKIHIGKLIERAEIIRPIKVSREHIELLMRLISKVSSFEDVGAERLIYLAQMLYDEDLEQS